METKGGTPGTKPDLQLLKLPQEIQDMIFALTYARRADVKIITPNVWHARERERRSTLGSDSYVKRPFPPRAVSQLLVSKQYLEAAASAYVGSCQVIFEGDPRWTKLSLLLQFVQRLVLEPGQACGMRYGITPELRTLVVNCSQANFFDTTYETENEGDADHAGDEPSSIIDDVFSDHDFESVYPSFMVQRFESLPKIEVVYDKDEVGDWTPAQRMIYTANLEAYERFLNARNSALKASQYSERTTEQVHKATHHQTFVAGTSSGLKRARGDGDPGERQSKRSKTVSVEGALDADEVLSKSASSTGVAVGPVPTTTGLDFAKDVSTLLVKMDRLIAMRNPDVLQWLRSKTEEHMD